MMLKQKLRHLLPVAALVFGGCHEDAPGVARGAAPVPTIKTPEAPVGKDIPAPAQSSAAPVVPSLQKEAASPVPHKSLPREKEIPLGEQGEKFAEIIRQGLAQDGFIEIRRAPEEETPALRRAVAQCALLEYPAIQGAFCFSARKPHNPRPSVFCGDVLPPDPQGDPPNEDTTSATFEVIRPAPGESCPAFSSVYRNGNGISPCRVVCIKPNPLVS